MLSEDIARRRLERPVEPDPDRPPVAKGRDGGALVDETTQAIAAHRRTSTEGHDLGERNWVVAQRVGELGARRDAETAIASAQIEKCAGRCAVTKPHRPRRPSNIGAFLDHRLDAYTGPGLGARKPRVQRAGDAGGLRGVTPLVPVRDGERAGRGPLIKAWIAVEVPGGEVDASNAAARLDSARSPEGKLGERNGFKTILTEAT